MTVPASGSPNAPREGAAAPASLSKGTQQMRRCSRSDTWPAPATFPAATWPAAETVVVPPIYAGETPVMSGVFETIVDAARPHAESLMPVAPRTPPGETSAHVMIEQASTNTAHRLVHSVACNAGITKSCCGSTKLAVPWQPSSNHDIRTAS